MQGLWVQVPSSKHWLLTCHLMGLLLLLPTLQNVTLLHESQLTVREFETFGARFV